MAPSIWEQIAERAKQQSQSSGLWLKLTNDRDTVAVVFLGDPYPRNVCFVDNKYVEFDDKLKAAGQTPKLRVAYNVALFPSHEVKVFEQGPMFFDTVFEVRKRFPTEKWAFSVERRGVAKDPNTRYTVLPHAELTAEQQRVYRSLAGHNLEALYGGGPKSAAAPRTFGNFHEKMATSDPSQVADLTLRLKSLPREAVDQFLTRFGVQRIKELPAAEFDNARAFVEQIAAQYGAPAPAEELDPFA